MANTMFCIHSLLSCQMLCGKGFEDGMCVGGCGIEIRKTDWFVVILPHLQYHMFLTIDLLS